MLLFLAQHIVVRGQEIIDTVESVQGPIVIYSDLRWVYLEDLSFDGVMNPQLDALISQDTTLNFIFPWDHDECYSSHYSNDINKLKDTIWLCLQENRDEGFYNPFGGLVTSGFGWRRGRPHNGTDIDLNTGDTVRAAWSGKVRYSKYNDGGFGYLVVIRHHNGLETFYAHLSKLMVIPNQNVKAGDPIGLGGNTGHSYGSHLHFEVRFYDAPINPEKLIDFKTGKVLDENLMVHRGLFKGGVSTSSSGAPVAGTQGAKYYRVRSGDTLSQIAARNRTTVSKICQLNGIRPTTVLQIGRNLRIQ